MGMERAAFETAVAEHGGKVFTLSVYLLRDPQEVLMRLWKHGSEVDPRKVGAWLLRVARNRCIDVIRARSTRDSKAVEDGRERLEEVIDDRAGPEQRARASQLRDRIRDALDGLTEPSRSVVILREIQGLTYEEIGSALEMPLSSVRVTLHRARIRLRDALREEVDHAAVC